MTFARRQAIVLKSLAATAKASIVSRSMTQYRICFIWNEGEAQNVEIIDYH